MEHKSEDTSESKKKTYDKTFTVDDIPETQTKRVKLDLEVDTSAKDLGPNPYVKWIHLARTFDAWRPFPRLFIGLYLYMVYRVIEWYIALPDPTMEQSGLISVVVGAGAAWFGLYVSSGKNSSKD